MADTVGHRFDQNGSLLREGFGFCGLNSGSDGESVVTVHTDGEHSVAWTTRGNAVSSELLRGGGGDGVAVVSDEEAAGCDTEEEQGGARRRRVSNEIKACTFPPEKGILT